MLLPYYCLTVFRSVQAVSVLYFAVCGAIALTGQSISRSAVRYSLASLRLSCTYALYPTRSVSGQIIFYFHLRPCSS